jgi:hypothetical protein
VDKKISKYVSKTEDICDNYQFNFREKKIERKAVINILKDV